MKIAVVGRGNTGSFVVKLVENSQHELVGPFHSENPLEFELIQDCQALILFVPALALADILPKISNFKGLIVSGATGPEINESFENQIRDLKLKWLQAHNFSLGMNLMKTLLEVAGRYASLFGETNYKLSETHHTKKLDAPSGTALRWKEWTRLDLAIESLREGDVVGDHELVINTQRERITLKHQAKSRELFAEGALWAAENFQNLTPGFYWFDEILAEKFKESE